MISRIKKEEFIGKTIKIVDSANKSLIDFEGKVIDETKNTLVISRQKSKKVLIKNNIKFKITIKDSEYIIDGKDIISSPEERIKLR